MTVSMGSLLLPAGSNSPDTIITSFPRRWGRNKPDHSGVHWGIRARLKQQTDPIQSVYDLALIIIDQCSRVFFDLTKPVDERPEMLDIFSNALSNVVSYHPPAHSICLFQAIDETKVCNENSRVPGLLAKS